MSDIAYSEEALPGSARHVRLGGFMDSNVAIQKGDALHEFVTAGGGTVLLNLSDLTYLSSGGVRVIILCAKTLHAAGGTLHIAAPQPRVMSVLTIAGFVPTFPVYQTLDEALAALSNGARSS